MTKLLGLVLMAMVITVKIARQDFGIDGIIGWSWDATEPTRNSEHPFIYFGLGQGFATCEDAIAGFKGSIERVWFDREKMEYKIESPCAGSI